jgi:hypothetical protein
MTENLIEALKSQIKRCNELVDVYRSIPTGVFGALMISNQIAFAESAIAQQDTAKMVQALAALRDCQ